MAGIEAGVGAGDGLLIGVTASGRIGFPLSPISRTTPSNRLSNPASSSYSASHIAYLSHSAQLISRGSMY